MAVVGGLLILALIAVLVAQTSLARFGRAAASPGVPTAGGSSAASAGSAPRSASPGPASSTIPSGSASAAGAIGPGPSDAAAAGGDPILVGAGDIADQPAGAAGADEATARRIDEIVAGNPGRVTVFVAGDNAYETGTAAEYRTLYDPTWGRFRSITRPVPGNHEYKTAGAAGYFGYFGEAAGSTARPYYAYDLGAWRIYALNSEIPHAVGSAQERWLRADLAAEPRQCVAAYWHRPRFSTGDHGSDTGMGPIWQALEDAGAEVVVSGHDHNYQRFAPMTATGVADPAGGIRQFVVGTGGRSLYTFSRPAANTEAWDVSTFGVLELTLHPTSYDFQFLPVAGASYSDGGTAVRCH